MKEVVEKLKKDIALTFEGADVRSVKFASTMLKNNGFSEIPAEYADFLKITNGLVWNGIEFYGSKGYDREGKDYSFPGIVDVNMDFNGFDALEGKLIIGRAPEELLVYAAKDNRWQCVDRNDFTVVQVAPSFKELFICFMDGMV